MRYHDRLLERSARLLDAHADVLRGRVHAAAAPAWARGRGWDGWLSRLDDAALRRAERCGLPSALDAGTPATLAALCDEAVALTAPLSAGARALPAFETHGVPLRKRTQVAALVARARARLPAPRRIVDLGAGHGHLTRALAAALRVPAVGIDRDPARVEAARAAAPALSYLVADERFEVGLTPHDWLVGLHACGRLGDALLERAAAVGCPVLLVSCCLQKIDAPQREPASVLGRALGVRVERQLLGVTNLSWGTASDGAIAGRAVRHALRLLLARRGIDEPPGREARGIQKRRFRRGLAAVADVALARRGLPPATDGEIAAAERDGAAEYALMRRFSLPRSMLGRVAELTVVLDRAAYLAERGYAVALEPMFDVDVSPRNLGLLAARDVR